MVVTVLKVVTVFLMMVKVMILIIVVMRPNFNRLLLTSNCPGLSPAEFQSTLQSGAGSLFRPPTLSRAPTPTGVTCFDASNARPTGTAPSLVASAAATPTGSDATSTASVLGPPSRQANQTAPNRQLDESGKPSIGVVATEEINNNSK